MKDDDPGMRNVIIGFILFMVFLLICAYVVSAKYDHRTYFIYDSGNLIKIYIDDTVENRTLCFKLLENISDFHGIWSIKFYGNEYYKNDRSGDYTPSIRRIRLFNINKRYYCSILSTLHHEFKHRLQHIKYGIKSFWNINETYLEEEAENYALEKTASCWVES